MPGSLLILVAVTVTEEEKERVRMRNLVGEKEDSVSGERSGLRLTTESGAPTNLF